MLDPASIKDDKAWNALKSNQGSRGQLPGIVASIEPIWTYELRRVDHFVEVKDGDVKREVVLADELERERRKYL